MKDSLQIVLDGGKLTTNEARTLIVSLLHENFDPVMLSSFLTAYVMRPVAAEELAGFLEGLLSLATPVSLDNESLDCCGTGGDGKDTFNISTLSAFVLAACGVKVVKHGNYASSSQCGSSNILEACGAILLRSSDSIKAQLEAAGITYLHAPYFHPALKAAAPVRKAIGHPTVFNLLGPLANPARPKYKFVGVMNSHVLKLYRDTLTKNGSEFAIVHSLDGYDEISLTGEFELCTNAERKTLSPREFGLSPVEPSALAGGRSIDEAKGVFMSVLRNEGTPSQNQVVCGNAAFALKLRKKELSVPDAYAAAQEALRSGRAFKCFEKFIEVSNNVSAR